MSASDHSLSGWHPADVKAAIQKRGQTLSGLALSHGYADSYLRVTLLKPVPNGEAIIARFLGVKPQMIWPERYDAKGNPRTARRRTSHLRKAA